jgi:hypothetical protein
MFRQAQSSNEQHQPSRWAILRRDLLNHERWFQGGKAAVTEVTRHFTDNITFLRKGRLPS